LQGVKGFFCLTPAVLLFMAFVLSTYALSRAAELSSLHIRQGLFQAAAHFGAFLAMFSNIFLFCPKVVTAPG
jgi:hypothetical protein